MNLELIRNKLKSNETNEIIAALNVLKGSGSLGDLPDIIPFTKHYNTIIQKVAINALCNIIREKLVSNFNELAPPVRKKLGILMESLHPAIVQEISKDIYSDDNIRRVRGVQILGLLRKNPQIRNILAELVTDKDEKIRATAVNLLGKIVGPKDHDIILSLLRDKDKRVRANTIEALESLGNNRMIPILQRFRKDQNNRIRGNVLKALYNLGNKEIEPNLLEMLESKDNFMAASALWVITQTVITTPKIEDAAGHCMISNNEMVLNNAENALTALNTPRTSGYLRFLGNL